MADYVTLSCPSCGGKLEISAEIDRFACGHCGNEHIVNRSGGIVSISPIVEGIKKVSSGVDATAAELAIIRIEKEISDLKRKLILDQTSPIPFISILLVIIGVLFCIQVIIDEPFELGLFLIALIVTVVIFYVGRIMMKNDDNRREKIKKYNKGLNNKINELVEEKNQYVSRIKNNKWKIYSSLYLGKNGRKPGRESSKVCLARLIKK